MLQVNSPKRIRKDLNEILVPELRSMEKRIRFLAAPVRKLLVVLSEHSTMVKRGSWSSQRFRLQECFSSHIHTWANGDEKPSICKFWEVYMFTM